MCMACYNYLSMARKKVSTTVYLTEDQVASLKELNRRTRVPIAEYIRLGIDMVLYQNSEHLPGQISLFEEAEEAKKKKTKAKKVLKKPDLSP